MPKRVRLRITKMCLDILDPCKICKFMCYSVLALFLVFIGGYLGKGIYLHANQDDTGDVALHDVLLDWNFWIPDGYFWVFGIAFVVLLFVAVVIVRGILIGLARLLNYLCCRVCCNVDYTEDLESNISEEKKSMKKGEYDSLEMDDKLS